MKVIRHEELDRESREQCTVTYIQGENDGMQYRTVRCFMDNGKSCIAWVCDCKPGYFIQAFVPFGDGQQQEVML